MNKPEEKTSGLVKGVSQMDEVKCPACEAALVLPLYIPGIAYRGHVRCSRCEAVMFVEVDRDGKLIACRQEANVEGAGETEPKQLTIEELQRMLASPDRFSREIFRKMKEDQANLDD